MKTKVLGLLAVCIGCSAAALAADVAARLELCCPLENSPAKGAAGHLRVPGEVFDRACNFPSDLRILDEAGVQWPFFVMIPADRTLSEARTPQVLNKAFVEGRDPHWELDLVLPSAGKAFIHNRLEIQTDGNEFVRRVEAFRDSADGEAARLAFGYLIGFQSNRNARNATVSYPDSDAERLHVRVYSDAKNANERFDLQQITVYSRTEIPAEYEPVPATRCPVPEKEPDERVQTFLLDTGFKNRPVERLTLDVTDRSFVRCVSVYGRNAGNEPWHSVGGGGIHRLETDEALTVPVRSACRWIKVEIRQDDNLPLEISGFRLEAVPRYVVFEAASDLPARLCFRGQDVPAPAYDLKKRVSETVAAALPVCETGAVQPNPQGAATSFFRAYSRIFGAAAVGAVSLLVVWIITGMMRRQQTGASG